jgi:Ca-activated chloride channel homolog
MSFAAPAAFLLAPLLGVIVAFYMLRVRREDRRVPSTFLWRALRQDPPATAPWQPPRRNLLLLLQLLCLAVLILALARPYRLSKEIVGHNLIVLVDRSASMAATDVAPSRLEAAKRQILDLVASAGDARVTLIAFDDSVEVLAAAQADPATLRAAVDRLQPVPVRGRLDDALTFATALAEGQPDTQIVLLSDGNLTLPADVTVPAPLHYIPIGQDDANQAVTALSISDRPGGAPPQLFAQVANFAAQPVVRRVETSLDGQLYDARDISIASGARESFTLDLPADARLAETRLQGPDALPLDDAAWAVRGPSAQARVTLVSSGNRFLETALGLLPAVAAVTVVSGTAGTRYGLTDVAVLDRVVTSPLPPGNLLIIAPDSPLGSIQIAGQLTDPKARVVRPEHRLVANARLDDVAILSATALELGAEWVPIVVADVDGRTWPLIADGTVDGRPAVVIAFDLRQSDLPLRPAFPLLMAAAMDLLAPSTVAGLPSTVAPGEPVSLRLSPQVDAAWVIDPAGNRHSLAISGGATRVEDTLALGPYRVEAHTAQGNQDAAFVVNLASAEESDIRPRPTLGIQQAGATSTGGVASQGRRELWWPLGLLALALLLAEWAYDHRAGLRRLVTARGETG